MLTVLTVVFAVGMVTVSSAAAHGPIWVSPSFKSGNCIKLPGGLWTFESEATCKAGTPKVTTGSWERMLGSGEKEGITFAGKGVTKLEVPGVGLTVSCESTKAGAGSTEIAGGSPGTSTLTIKLEKCKDGSCEANSPGAAKGIIEFKANAELAYRTKVAAEKEEGPLLVVFRTTESEKKEVVKIEGGECLASTTVLANGTNKTAMEEGKVGVATMGCLYVTPTPPVVKANEIICEETVVKKYFWWKAGVVTEGSAGLELSTLKLEAKQVGDYVVELKSGEPWAAAG
jgi:hypothetical protein